MTGGPPRGESFPVSLDTVCLDPDRRKPDRLNSGGASLRIAAVRSGGLLPAVLLILTIALGAPAAARSQSSLPTASRVGDLQIGGGFVFAHSGYNFTPINLIGVAGYATFDWHEHWGVEGDFRHSRATADNTIYERTYEIGPRVFLHHGPISPYAKFMIGRGVYNFHNNIANVAYNLYSYGGGADLSLRPWLNLRGDYELQNWVSFPLGTLHPSVITIGLAYHFH